ncbi:MAG: diguanylate cyclase [Lachnospiraceae bacterium]|nr:diguanylate cyclase [Lachnospiraceae bacterium]
MSQFFLTGTLFLAIPAPELISIVVSVVAVVLFAVFLIKSIHNREEAERNALALKRITNSVGAGLVNYLPNEDGLILFASARFYSMIGYSKDEVEEKFDGKFFSIVSPEHRALCRTFEYENGENVLRQEILVHTRERNEAGEVVLKEKWFLLTGNIIRKRNGRESVSAVMVDVTKDHEMNEHLSMEKERYKVVSELSNDIIFSYSYRTDTIEFGEGFDMLFTGDSVRSGFLSDKSWREKAVHREDLETFGAICSIAESGREEVDEQVRLKTRDGKYIWCRIIAKAIKSRGDRGTEVIGKIMNIDRHKRELSELESKAMRDPMTGALNKESTRVFIENYIERYPDMPGMFLILDIDKFKNVNDTYGHLMGDKVLIRAVNEMRKAFRSDDIIGRIGGDEFVVFIGNIRSNDIMIKQAKKLHEVLRTPAVFEEVTIPMSASIGIALFPEHGRSYEDLLACADRALYEVKGTTRDAFIVYDGRPM